MALGDINNIIGESLTPEFLRDMIVDGRIQFPLKPTKTSAISQPGDKDDYVKEGETNVDDLIDSVKENEDMVKLLEDMRDDMLAGMNIPPANDSIAEAAKALGSADGSITKQVFDTAEAILDPIIMEPNLIGYSSIIAALTGNGKVEGDFLDCNKVTKGIADTWNVVANQEGPLTADELHKKGAGQAIQDSRQSFSDKMAQMASYIFSMLWWEKIWARVVLFFIETTEKLIAVPIDTPFLILRFFKKLTKKNYYKYGPIHKLLNKLKVYLLCTVPKKAWKPYNPDPKIKVWRQKQKKFITLQELCSQNNDVVECPGTDAPIPVGLGSEEEGNANWDDDEDKMQKQMKDKLNSAFPDGDPECIATRFSSLFPEEKFDGPGMSPACMDAAKKVMDAVYDDAMKFGEYEGTKLQAEQGLQAIIKGDIKSAQGGM